MRSDVFEKHRKFTQIFDCLGMFLDVFWPTELTIIEI